MVLVGLCIHILSMYLPVPCLFLCAWLREVRSSLVSDPFLTRWHSDARGAGYRLYHPRGSSGQTVSTAPRGLFWVFRRSGRHRDGASCGPNGPYIVPCSRAGSFAINPFFPVICLKPCDGYCRGGHGRGHGPRACFLLIKM